MLKPPLLLAASLAAAALLVAGCGGHPDDLARRFYERMSALDIAGMEELVCEDDRSAFRGSVGILEGFSPDRPFAIDGFRARTERSNGTSATMRISGRFVSDGGADAELSGRIRLVRQGGEWCVSGEGDGFRAVRENAAEAYFLLYDGGVSSDIRSEGYGRPALISPETRLNTPAPGGPPPVLALSTTTASGLTYQDLAPGSGPQPSPGDTVLVHYTMWLAASGDMIDTSRGGGKPFEFVLGGGLVVDGFDEGVATMREGGQRRLIIPPRLGYGDDDDYEDIPPNSTLIFDVELVEVR